MKRSATAASAVLLYLVFGAHPGFAQKTKFVQDLSIQSSESDEPGSFLMAERVEADSRGNIYVLASREYKVQVYSPKGEYLRTIGKKGQGPGEFEMPVYILVGKDDRLYVFDYLKAAFVVFDPEGKFVKNVSTKGQFHDIPLRIVFDAAGNFVLGYDSTREGSFKVSRFDLDFNKVEDLYVRTGISSILRKPGGVAIQAPFPPFVIWALDGNDRLFACYNQAYEIEVFGPDHQKSGIMKRDFTRDEVTKADIDEQVKGSRGLLVPADFPRFKPAPARLFFVGPLLFVLVKRIGPEPTYLFHEFDSNGAFLEERSMNFQPFVYKNGFVYSVRASPDFSSCEVMRFKVTF